MILFCPRCGAELHEMLKGEWFESPVRCTDCGLSVADPPLMLARGPADDEVEYSLDDWPVPERAMAVRALVEVDIPYRWEPGLVLVVPTVAEEEVDQLFEDLAEADGDAPTEGTTADVDEVDAPRPADLLGDDGEAGDDGDEDEADGGEEAQAAMADLFVAADRLQHSPADPDLGGEVAGLADTVDGSAPPYGIARPVWRRIQALSATVASGLAEGADEETVATDARALRDFLRDLV